MVDKEKENNMEEEDEEEKQIRKRNDRVSMSFPQL